MAFDLYVHFTGLCLYVLHPTDDTRAAVLMPEARKGKADEYHLDDDPAEPHVGFLRVNLADVRGGGLQLPAGCGENGPAYELVHRFDGEVLEFEDLPSAQITGTPHVPDFAEFAPGLDLLPDLFGSTPPPQLLMRCVLTGGELLSEPGLREWRFSRLLAGNLPEYKRCFAPYVTWKRRIDSDCITLRISNFAGSCVTRLRLGPSCKDEEVAIEVANLCAFNPFEWKDLPERMVHGTDEDFKWLYRLLTPAESDYPAVLKGASLPAPRLRRGSPRSVTGDEDCMGATLTRAWPTGSTARDAAPDPVAG